jgi:hypothetical protein
MQLSVELTLALMSDSNTAALGQGLLMSPCSHMWHADHYADSVFRILHGSSSATRNELIWVGTHLLKGRGRKGWRLIPMLCWLPSWLSRSSPASIISSHLICTSETIPVYNHSSQRQWGTGTPGQVCLDPKSCMLSTT